MIFKRKITIPVIIFLLFVLSFFISVVGLFGLKYWLRLPFYLIALLPWIPAVSIGTNCYLESPGHGVCDVSIAYGLYFLFSFLYALIVLLIQKPASALTKSNGTDVAQQETPQYSKPQEERKAILKYIGYLLATLGILIAIFLSFLAGIPYGYFNLSDVGQFLALDIGLPLLLIGLLLVLWGQPKRGKVNIIFTFIVISSLILVINYSWFHIFELFTPLTNWMERRVERIKLEALNARDPQKCLNLPKVKTIPFLPKTISDFLFPSTEEKLASSQKDCLLDIAVFYEDESICNEAKVIKAFDDCISKVAVAKRDSSVCKVLKYGSACFYAVAKATNDESLCEKAPWTQKNSCYCQIMMAKKDPDLCKDIEIKYEQHRVKCCKEIIVAKRDPDLCEKAIGSTWSFYQECYYEIAILNGDPSLCEKLTGWTGLTRSDCRIKSVAARKDANLCREFFKDDEASLKRCLEEVKK